MLIPRARANLCACCRWLTQHWRQKLQPGTAANCCPTQVIYPLPSGWTVLEGRLQLPAAAAASAAAAAGKAAGSSSTRGSRAGSPEQQQQGLTLEEFHELQVAASDAAKHPVTWRSMQEKVWCEVGGMAHYPAAAAANRTRRDVRSFPQLWLHW